MTTDTNTLLARVDLSRLVTTRLHGNERERYGPCPKCGGEDRFHIRHHQGRDYFFCRKCHEQRGDAIEFMRWLHGYSFADAVRELGGNLGATSKPQPTPATRPAQIDLPPSADWQNRMRPVLAGCTASLWSAKPIAIKARAYLHQRGLTDDTIKAWGIGYNIADRRMNDHWLYTGFTLPTIICGDIWQVRTRTPPKLVGATIGTGTRQRKKYEGVTGNRIGLMNADALTGAHTAIICAGEFDAMLCQQFAPAGVACVTFGSESKGVSLRWLIALRSIKRVVVCYDNDAAGDAGYERIKRDVPKALRARVPTGKDIGEFYSQGGDIAAWSREIAEQSAQDITPAQWESTILSWLESRGYTPSIGEQGEIIANREALLSARPVKQK